MSEKQEEETRRRLKNSQLLQETLTMVMCQSCSAFYPDDDGRGCRNPSCHNDFDWKNYLTTKVLKTKVGAKVVCEQKPSDNGGGACAEVVDGQQPSDNEGGACPDDMWECPRCGGSCAPDGYCKDKDVQCAIRFPSLNAKIPSFYRPAKVIDGQQPSHNRESSGAEVVCEQQPPHNGGTFLTGMYGDYHKSPEMAECHNCGNHFAGDSECKGCENPQLINRINF